MGLYRHGPSAIAGPMPDHVQASAVGWVRARSAQFVKEGRDVAGKQFGFLGGREVTAPRHGRPPADIVQALRPLARRGAVVDELVSEDGDRGWHRDDVGQGQLRGYLPVICV